MARQDDVLRNALIGVLEYERQKAKLQGLSDCTCINHSREAERAYENGECPHQIAQANLSDAIVGRADQDGLHWHSPHEIPGYCGTTARRVLVWLERIDNPPAMNAPGKMSFGHRIVHPDPPSHWPRDGWFFDGQADDYRVAAWAYADPPHPTPERARE